MAQGRLLILDDDATVGQVLLMGAQVSGFEARHCTEVEAFFEALTGWPPSHVAIDLTLPGTSGAGAAELAAALAETRVLGLDGAGVLPKPFALATLRQLLA